MRNHRNHADYDLHKPLRQVVAAADLKLAQGVVKAIADAALEPNRTKIIDAMRIYERDVLGDVTWQTP